MRTTARGAAEPTRQLGPNPHLTGNTRSRRWSLGTQEVVLALVQDCSCVRKLCADRLHFRHNQRIAYLEKAVVTCLRALASVLSFPPPWSLGVPPPWHAREQAIRMHLDGRYLAGMSTLQVYARALPDGVAPEWGSAVSPYDCRLCFKWGQAPQCQPAQWSCSHLYADQTKRCTRSMPTRMPW